MRGPRILIILDTREVPSEAAFWSRGWSRHDVFSSNFRVCHNINGSTSCTWWPLPADIRGTGSYLTSIPRRGRSCKGSKSSRSLQGVWLLKRSFSCSPYDAPLLDAALPKSRMQPA